MSMFNERAKPLNLTEEDIRNYDEDKMTFEKDKLSDQLTIYEDLKEDVRNTNIFFTDSNIHM